MKYFFPIVLTSAFLLSCENSNKTPGAGDSTGSKDSLSVQYFGDSINADGAIAAAEVKSKLGTQDSMEMKVTGVIEAVCQKKGCWMEVALNDTESMRVTFKDYGFFVPKDASGRTVVIDGYAFNDTTTVAELKEYAKDDGASKEEIEKITEPEAELVFVARGVIIQK